MVPWWPSHLFTRRTDVSRQYLVKSRSREIGWYNNCIALTLNRHFGRAAAEGPVKCQSDWKSLNPNLSALRLHQIVRYDVRPLIPQSHRTATSQRTAKSARSPLITAGSLWDRIERHGSAADRSKVSKVAEVVAKFWTCLKQAQWGRRGNRSP